SALARTRGRRVGRFPTSRGSAGSNPNHPSARSQGTSRSARIEPPGANALALNSQPEKRASRWEGLTVWGKAKAILSGKSRGANLVILAIFLVSASGVTDALTSRLGVPSETGLY